MSIYEKQMAEQSSRYDEDAGLVWFFTEGHEYHSHMKGWLHSTNASTGYAVLLLQNHTQEERADKILRTVMGLQCTDPEDPCFGGFPWYLEEPLDQMDPPDMNFAAFIGRDFIRAIQYGYPKEVLKDALIMASRSIMKRAVQPGYMNICIMSSMVTLCTGGLYNEPEIFTYGKELLRKFADYGYMTEYNSHRYMGIASKLLALIWRMVPDQEVKDLAKELSDRFWEAWAQHYHPESGQLCGPYSRAYFTYLPQEDRDTILSGVHYDDAEFRKYGWLECPEEYKHYFEKTEEPRMIRKQYAPDVDPQGPENFYRGAVASSYLTPEFCVGSVSKSDMWSQRRTVLAFWGGRENTASFTVRCLHDGLHFCGAIITSRQEKGRVESTITFDPRGFDTHCNLDPIREGKIRAEDLRIVFSFENTEPRFLTVDPVYFDGRAITPVRTERGIELPLYTGEKTVLDLNALGKTEIHFVFEIRQEDLKNS